MNAFEGEVQAGSVGVGSGSEKQDKGFAVHGFSWVVTGGDSLQTPGRSMRL